MLPPSVNHYVKHGVEIERETGQAYVGHRKTPAAKKFADDFGLFVNRLDKKYVTGDRFQVYFHLFFGPGDRGDWDNFPKCLSDAIAKSGMLHDRKGREISDAHIKAGHVFIHDSEDDRKIGPKTEITIEALPRFDWRE